MGKTSVARELRRRVAGSVIYDPEWAGMVMQRLPALVPLQGRGTDDFQDVELWRRSVVAGTRLIRAFARGPVFVPMTFSNLDYLASVASGIRSFEPGLRVFCLVASLDVVRTRIRERSAPLNGTPGGWLLRRTAECVRAHEDPRFGERVETEGRSITNVAEHILDELEPTAG